MTIKNAKIDNGDHHNYTHVEVHPVGAKGRLRLDLMNGSNRLGSLEVSGPADEKFLKFFHTIYGHRV